MTNSFYFSKEYREKQSSITKKNWEAGKFDFLRKREIRKCARKECNEHFEVILSSPKIFCSQSCSAIVSNKKRGGLSKETKEKISKANKGKVHLSRRGKTRVKFECNNPECRKIFLREPYRKPKFCSIKCSIKVTGSRVTSHKAARGKAGVRPDIDDNIYFYSRWEANIARLYNYKKISWIYAPDTFDIGGQNYTPDFYLPKDDKYVEVKNFWWKYSKERDEKFRKMYPHTKLEVILKDEYLRLEKRYAKHIPEWEYNNSK